MKLPVFLNRCLELNDAGASGGLLLSVTFCTGDGRGEDAASVELTPEEVVGLHFALDNWLKQRGYERDGQWVEVGE